MNLYHTYASGLLNLVFGSGVINKPATIAFGLTSVVPTNTSIQEILPTGVGGAFANGYARQVLGPNVGVNFYGPTANWNFPVELSGIVYNNLQITFPICVSGGWGYASGAFLADSAAWGAGNIIAYTALGTPKDIELNDQFYIPVSGVSFRFW